MPQIEVAFDIDANGILHVSAKDLGTGKEQKIRIESSSGLSPAEVEQYAPRTPNRMPRMTSRKRELVDARNEADQIIYEIEKLLKEHADKLSDADKAPIQSAIEKVKQVPTGDDTRAMRQAIDELKQAAQAMSKHIYNQPGGPGAQTATDGQTKQSKGKDDVIDAEFEVKK